MNNETMPYSSLAHRFLPGRILAAPSWVMPGTVATNCAFLATRVDEVGLLFFEHQSALAYGPEDLPPSLAELPLTWHVHLPLDLPMHRAGKGLPGGTETRNRALSAGGDSKKVADRAAGNGAHMPGNAPTGDGAAESACICRDLLQKVAYLGVRRAVLHPPPHNPADAVEASRTLAAFAEAFAACGGDTAGLLLENTRDNDLLHLAGVIREHGFAVCPDMGHMLAYGQQALLSRTDLMERACMIHINAPGGGNGAGHRSLPSLDRKGREQARALCRAVPPDAVVMMELFDWARIEESLPLAGEWLAGEHA